MVLILDGNSEIGTHAYRLFDLFKAFDYLESDHTSHLFLFEMTYFASGVRNMFWFTIYYKYNSKNIMKVSTLQIVHYFLLNFIYIEFVIQNNALLEI